MNKDQLRDRDLIEQINYNSRRDHLLLAILFGAISGFLVGIVLTSLFHKFIVHPLGY